MVFNATVNNISVISWWSVLLLEENGEKLVESGVKHDQTNKPNISENTCNSFNQYSVSMMLVIKLDGSY
jgi:hypothetical protein